MDEQELIRKVCQKNRKAQRLLFDKYYAYLYSVVVRYKNDHHKAEEVVSTVFNNAFKNIRKFEYRGDQSLKKWLLTIAINEALRNEKKQISIHFADDFFPEEMVDETDPLNEYEGISIDRVLKVIDELPGGYKTILLMYSVDGLSHSEIAVSLNISRNTSKSQLRKARLRLIKKLEDETRKV